MKKLILTLLIFFSFTIPVYVISVILVGSFFPNQLKKNVRYNLGSKGHLYSRLKEINNLKKTDILFLGSSHTYRGFDTRIFKKHGFNSFNLGSSAQSHIQTELLLHRYIDKINPKTVIYEIYPFVFTIDGHESSIDIISNDINDHLSLNMALKTLNIKVYNTYIFSYFNQIIGNHQLFKENKIRENDTYIKGGYVERILTFNSPKSKRNKKTLKIKNNQTDAFKRNIALLRKKNINVILVQSPVNKSLYNSISNMNDFNQIIKSTNLPYYNFNETKAFDDSLHFFDHHHLNQTGVNLFNELLIQKL